MNWKKEVTFIKEKDDVSAPAQEQSLDRANVWDSKLYLQFWVGIMPDLQQYLEQNPKLNDS